jgi:hypothetical protein
MVRRSPPTGFSETAAVRLAAMSEAGGMELPRDEPERVPVVVQIAVWSAWALAASLLLFGFIGFLISNAIGNGVGGGSFVVGLIVAGAAYLLSRGNAVARAFIGLGAAATAVVCVIYAFTGPGSAVIPSLVIGALAAGTFALLYVADSAKQFYASR